MSLYDALLVLKGIGTRTENQILLQNMYQGNLLAMILNTTPRKTRKVYRWSDFYPDRKEKKEMTNEEIREKLHGMFGGK